MVTVKKQTKKSLLVLEKLHFLQALESKHFGRWLAKRLSCAIKHLPDTVDLIKKVFKNCVILSLLLKLKKSEKIITCILASPRRSSWTIFLDKLTISTDQNMLTIVLFKTLARELISNAKDSRQFWTPAYEELSEKLWLPIKTGLADLGSISSKELSLKQVAKLPCLTSKKTSLRRKSSQKTCYQLSTSLVADKWEEEAIADVKTTNLKTLSIQVFPTQSQKKKYNEFYGCYRHIHNRTLERIKCGDEPNFQNLRNILVTENTKMNSTEYKVYNTEIQRLKGICADLKPGSAKTKLEEVIKEDQRLLQICLQQVKSTNNPYVLDWETSFPKDTRACAVNKVCESYKTAIANFKAGNIKFFSVSYMKKTSKRKCFEMTSKQVSVSKDYTSLKIPFFGNEKTFKLSNKMQKKLKKDKIEIVNSCDFICHKNKYYINICVPTNQLPPTNYHESPNLKFTAVDLGLVKTATTFGNTGTTEFKHNREYLKKLNDRINYLKNERKCRVNKRRGVRKQKFNKLEKKKIDLANNIHWALINELLAENDVIFIGDIKSHDIVKNGKNRKLNQEFNDMKFYLFKQRLLYKATILGKKVISVPEHYTSQGCSQCGNLYKVNSSRVYSCNNCEFVSDRDINAAKNILMKGIQQTFFLREIPS